MVHADELECHIRKLETEDIAKDHELNSLKNCSKNLGETLVLVDEKLRIMTRELVDYII